MTQRSYYKRGKRDYIICKDEYEAEELLTLICYYGYDARICCFGGFYNAIEVFGPNWEWEVT